MDFFRYLILYEFGGKYSDMDFIPVKKISNNLLNYDFIGYKACRNHRDHYLEDNNGIYSDKSYTINDNDGKWVLGQAFFSCKKHYKGIKYIIDDIVKNSNLSYPVLHHTGPEAIHRIFIKNNLLFNKNTFIFSKKDINNDKGEYGYHLRHHQW